MEKMLKFCIQCVEIRVFRNIYVRKKIAASVQNDVEYHDVAIEIQ